MNKTETITSSKKKEPQTHPSIENKKDGVTLQKLLSSNKNKGVRQSQRKPRYRRLRFNKHTPYQKKKMPSIHKNVKVTNMKASLKAINDKATKTSQIATQIANKANPTPLLSITPSIASPLPVMSSKYINNDANIQPMDNKDTSLTNKEVDGIDNNTSEESVSSNKDEENTEIVTPDAITAAAVSKMDAAVTDLNTIQTNNRPSTSHIVGLILGIFGGIAFLAAAMFLLARKRKKPSTTNSLISNKGESDHGSYDENVLQEISLDDKSAHYNKDEIIEVGHISQLDPIYTPAITEKQHTEYYTDYLYDKNEDNYTVSERMSDHQSMTDTLVGSQAVASRASSYSLKHRQNSLRLSRQTSVRRENARSSWHSTTSTAVSDTISPITSTIMLEDMPSLAMVAERYLLQHKKASIYEHLHGLSYYNGLKSTPIETYKAQLSNIDDFYEDEEFFDAIDEHTRRDSQMSNIQISDSPFPFSTIEALKLSDCY